MAKICLDAGHAKKYNRSPVVPEYYESDMNWKLHLFLKDELLNRGFEVITTRPSQNEDLGLYERGFKSKGCDLFLSLHSNACGTESVDRIVPIAQLEDNKYDFDEVSRELGNLLGAAIRDTMGVKEYRMITKKSDNDRDGNGIKDDEYYGVLHGAKAARVPGLILEHSFHTNTRAAKWLLVDDNLKKLAKAETEVLAKYFDMEKEEIKTDAINPMNYSDAEFIEIIAENVNKIKEEYGIKVASPIIAQACLESGYGKSNKAKFYNFFGLKYRKDRVKCHSGYFNDSSSEQLEDGTYIPISTDWYAFDGFYNGVKGYMEFINIDRYKNLKGITDPLKYLETIREDGYATSLDYVKNVYNVITKWNLTKYDNVKVEPEKPKEEVEEIKKWYRVRLSWEDSKSQLGAYAILENAKAACKEGYTVYDWNGNAVYSNKKEEVKAELKEGDVITLKAGCTYYNGKMIPSWVFKSTLYYRGKNNNGIIFSTLKTGAITGVVKEENVITSKTITPTYRTHTVKKGDSLWAIAEKYLGDGNRYKEIKELNGLKSNVIYAGNVLKIPNK